MSKSDIYTENFTAEMNSSRCRRSVLRTYACKYAATRTCTCISEFCGTGLPRARVCAFTSRAYVHERSTLFSTKATAANRRNVTLASFQWKNTGFPLPSSGFFTRPLRLRQVLHAPVSFLSWPAPPKNDVRTNRLRNFQAISALSKGRVPGKLIPSILK